ncbi:neuraminidase-like domain-containing protein [Dehalobacterium formicoaceticum]|uniref:Neuraminidase-like domain-containing protein n=1 Tax=Dehalobacterium formicoaceticum TaxID=51515 RepID=A0ABT1Y348_9FIRM|nr:neuraminidase-like domain-containing protein [Dehalobacterium formicoaceticum]MCR6544585.1 neuraminidase-like domain-containing protein [Dehalobacterium formicoaceticum]
MANRIDNPKLMDLKINFFKADLKSEQQQKTFEVIFKKNEGDWPQIKADLVKLKGEEGFTPKIIQNIEFTQKLADWSHDNEELISAFQKDRKLNSMNEIALSLSKEDFIKKVEDLAPVAAKEDKKAYAVNLHRSLFAIEPTAMVVNMIKDPKVPLLNDAIGGNLTAVLEKQPDFNIKTTSVYEIIKNEENLGEIPGENRESVVKNLKILQRITALSPDTDALPVLYKANLHSALEISALPEAQFVSAMRGSGLDETMLLQIHSNAQQVRVRNEQAIMALREAGRGTGIAMIDKSMNKADAGNEMHMLEGGDQVESLEALLKDTLTKHNLSWELLFGDADFCQCEECDSVYSAASYYVELLQYLRNNNLDPNLGGEMAIKPNAKDIAGTPLEKLFLRRPDLGCLELTCKNTNTILPYVDLVNEVMENYVAFKQLKTFNVEDETSGELLAEPQHTEYQAYCILKNAVYPFTLPYHQPVDAARIYLDYLDTSRYEVIKTFRKNNESPDQDLTRFKDEELDRAADAEFLGLTMEEYVILTKECFESRALMDKLKNKSHTDDEYQQLIGVKPVCRYYGFDDDATMLGDNGLTLIKKEFLRRTGIDYLHLVELLKTAYINPHLPKGKGKRIMESLHFSYRFLQNYAAAHGLDKMAEDLVKGEKLAELAPLLKDEIGFPTGKSTLSCPKSYCAETEISDQEIIHWVKCSFEKAGRMIVIESGKGCVDGEIIIGQQGISHMTTAMAMVSRSRIIVEKCKIYLVLNNKEQEEIGSIDKNTGAVSLKDPYHDQAKSIAKDLFFVGVKGEKGRFLIIEGQLYLVMIEQKDSCDLDTALLQHLDGTPLTADEYDRIHRFIRLWKKLGWTIDETDQALAGLGGKNDGNANPEESICADCFNDECIDTGCSECPEDQPAQLLEIDSKLIHQLAAVKELLDRTGLELIKLLTFWNEISTRGERSLYQRLFLTHNVLGIDKVFKADDQGNFLGGNAKLGEHLPAVMAALNLSADDIQTVLEAALEHDGERDQLNLENLSLLYRFRLLSKVLGVKIPALIKIMTLFGQEEIFKNAHASLEFINRWQRMEEAGFTYQQLSYIIMDKDDEKKPLAPSQKSMLLTAKNLYDGLNAIDAAHQDLKADAAINDPSLQKINILEQATGDLIRTKAGLIFDSETAEKIIGILEGTNTFITNAPKNLILSIPDSSTLQGKLKYDKSGTVQVTGILTPGELFDYQNLDHSADWVNTLTRIQKQQDKLFKELLSGIFENEKTKTAAEKTQLEEVIKSGDITMPIEEIPVGEEDPNTAPKKRAAFLAVFLPYLRQELSRRFIMESLANFSGLDLKATDVLIAHVLKTGTPEVPIYDVFEKIKESAKPDTEHWSGYLIPPKGENYRFIVKNQDNQPTVTIDGEILDFTALEDPTNEWWSEARPLQSGKLYQLTTTGIELKNIFWKTPASTAAPIPSSALIPDFASERCAPALVMLKKAALLVSAFNLNAAEIQFLDRYKSSFDHLDFNALTLLQWLRLEAYVRLRNSLPQGEFNLLEFWKWVFDPGAEESKLSEKIAALTGWKKERIEKLIAQEHFNIHRREDYQNEINLLKLQQALKVADKTGVDIDRLFEWAVPTSHFKTCRKTAESIKFTIRAKYNQSDWEQAAKPLHDQLRNNQKEALTGYLLQQKELLDWNVIDADGLFEYFLIDVQMDACMETSRIKQAISSVQLFIQRCFLGLEEEKSGIKPDVLDRKRWDWMQRYRVWEANRKVFLYPENWIESNLRDDKSPFFKELESELLQKDINRQNVTDALKSYLYKVDEVANLEVVGLYIEMKSDEWGNKTNAPRKLHIFARTRNAPYMFYYRYFEAEERNWYPWEKMQLDIPSYDALKPDAANVGTAIKDEVDNGCYLIPALWNHRLLVFFPQIIKKTKPSSDAAGGKFETLGKDSDGIGKSKPIEYYEIKMAWSEYRNGKWTQKQVSKDAVFSNQIDNKHDLQFFKFVQIVYADKVLIDVDDFLDSDGGNKGAFVFDGTSLKTAAQVSTEAMPIDYFNQQTATGQSKRLYSWQINSSSLSRENKEIYFYDQASREKIQGLDPYLSEFNHPDTHKLLGMINIGALETFFRENLALNLDSFGPFDHDDSSITPNSYHELKRPYSLYNWELFFHTPILLANALSKGQHYEEAMKWFHFVFNPIAQGTEDTRFWQFSPFKQINSQRILDSIFNNLKPNTGDKTISEWRNKPFMPHMVARSRPVAYMKWVVMKYLDNLIAWADHLFRQDTIETINQAIQLYVYAGHILGRKPMMIPKRGKKRAETYLGLLDKWDAFGNAMVELELAAPFSNQTTLPFSVINGEIAMANIFGTASAGYFFLPNNPKLMGYWDTLADRLFKIRHCLNIEGVFRKLPLFEPPIDPALLVKAAAQGLSIESVLNDLNTPMPNYRFYYLLQKALELCSELKTLGSTLLAALEKKDNETIDQIRAKHEGGMQNLLMEIKKKQLEEAQKNLDSLTQNRLAPEAKMKYYLKLSGLDESLVPDNTADFNGIPNDIVTVDGESGLKLIPFEKEDMDKASAAADWQTGIGAVETLASVFHALPSMTVDGKPFGVGAGVIWGFPNLANATTAVGRGLKIYADHLLYQSQTAGKKGGFTRALQERVFQANLAGYELKQIDKQITAQEIRINIAEQEIKNQQQAIDNAYEAEEFIRNKYTNEELYTWIRGSLKTLYHQVYNQAYELAKKAEKTYCFERGIGSANFIQSGYFDAGRDGLLAGEQLYVGLKQLEAAYQNERGYDYEVSKQISLYQLNPLAVMQLRETGKCEFEIPEVLFDMDYPGHYKRRIKAVALSIPCIAGPYTGVNATLTLLKNKFRNTAIGGKAYEEDQEETDPRFSSYAIPINGIAASSGQNDTGMFELNFRDERYLPFEGAGVISRWRLELPKFRQFDYHSIADCVIHFRYTACEGGEKIKGEANKHLGKWLKTLQEELQETGLMSALNLKLDLPNQWHLLKNKGTVDLMIEKSRLPYPVQALNGEIEIENVVFAAQVKDNMALTIKIDANEVQLEKRDELKMSLGASTDISLDTSFKLSLEPDQLKNLDGLTAIVKYHFKKVPELG